MNRRKRILTVEDEFLFRAVIGYIFRDKYDVHVASNGAEAWRRMEAEHFDLLITDYQMPYMNGLALARQVRSTPAYKTLPIIIVTAKAFEFDLTVIEKELMPCEIFFKPFNRTQLRSSVARLLADDEASLESLPVGICEKDRSHLTSK